MIPTLESLCEASLLASLDRHFARALGRMGGESRPEVLLAAALASRETAAGHTCLELDRLERLDGIAQLQDSTALPSPSEWRERLASSSLVALAGEAATATSARGPQLDEARPLILDAAGRLYLRRYWSFQQRLAEAVRARAASPVREIDEALLVAGLDRLFGASGSVATSATATPVAAGEQTTFDFGEPGAIGGEPSEIDRQRLAAAVAVSRRFAVISGGPGTGKTATAVKILALIIEQAFARETAEPPRIALVAPTGKAAATLAGSIAAGIDALACAEEVKQAIPTSAFTIHRCLGVWGGVRPRFRHDAEHPLSIDVLLVDEASMVDLALMTRLLSAVPEHARVILLGDEHQLASVEAGAVLGDICTVAEPPGYSSGFAERLDGWMGGRVERADADRTSSNVRDGIVRLLRSYRYDPERGIGALARAINRGDAAGVLEILDSPEHPEVSRSDFEPRGASQPLQQEIIAGFGDFLEAADPNAMLERFSAFRVLSPLRQGRGGVEELNREIEAVLRREGLIRSRGVRYPGRPILVQSNDYVQELFNGDVGFVLPLEGGVERVAFPGAGAAMRVVAASRLPEHETAFAMTIHKSQGSEFDRVAIVISELAAQRASRQLLYTAVTRARSRVTLYASEVAIAQAVERETRRSSGLGDALRSPH